MPPDLSGLFNSKAVISGVSAVGGALFWNFVAAYRDRVKVLEYTVTHDRIGLSATDVIFGRVVVTWEGHNLTNLFASSVTVSNTTSSDYTGVRVKVYTGNTLLLNERSEISGTTYIPKLTEAYLEAIRVAPGEAPTDEQLQKYRHEREYVIPVFNRGQRVVFTYLTTVPIANEGPLVWVDMLHPGAKVLFRPTVQQIHGVPVRLAVPIGLLASLLAVVLVVAFVKLLWLAALICIMVGLMAQSIGAGLYWVFRFVKYIVLK